MLFDWEKNRLEVRFSSGDNALDLSAPVTEDSVQRSVGGHCQLREGEHVQVLLKCTLSGFGLGPSPTHWDEQCMLGTSLRARGGRVAGCRWRVRLRLNGVAL